MIQYTVGSVVELRAAFTDQNGTPKDPSTLAAYVLQPDGTQVDLTSAIVHENLGDFYAPFTPTMNGLHEWRFTGAGDIAAAGEGAFMAQLNFAPAP